LLAGGGDPGVVHPVGGEPLTGGTRLGLLVLVVREAQIHAAAVDVEGVAEILAGHRRALDVPAGTTAAPRRGPRRGARLLLRLPALPEREVAGVTLATGVRVGGGLHVLDLLAGELSVVGEGTDVE